MESIILNWELAYLLFWHLVNNHIAIGRLFLRRQLQYVVTCEEELGIIMARAGAIRRLWRIFLNIMRRRHFPGWQRLIIG